jgi:hypothetical protein
MSTLQGKTPAATFKDLLQISNGNVGIDTTMRYIEDGEGTASIMSLSTTQVALGTTSPAAGTLLDMVSTTKAFGLMSMTNSQRDAITGVREGIMIYDNVFHSPAFYYLGWRTLSVPFTLANFFGAAQLEFAEASTNGSQKIILAAPASVATTDKNVTFKDQEGVLSIEQASVTVAGLPSAATPYQSYFVSDALAPVWGATVVGGGAVKCRVMSDGANWVVG